MAIKKIRLPDNSEQTLDAELLSGYAAQKYYPTVAYNYTTGCFCKTSLSTANSTVVYIEIVGRNHATTGTFYATQAKAYWTSGAFTTAQCKAVRYGDAMGNITFFSYDSKLCFWFKVATGNCSFYVSCRAGSAGRNYVTEITNEAIPADATGNTVVTPTVAFSGTYLSASAPAASITSTDITNWNTAELPSVTTSDATKSLIVNSSGVWTKGYVAGVLANEDRRIINATTQPLYQYKICGFNTHGKILPLTLTNQTTNTIVEKTPLSAAIDPYRGLVYYSGTTAITDTSTRVSGLFYEKSAINVRYTFNTSIPAASEVFLKGTFNGRTFTLDTSTSTSWYVAPSQVASQANYNAVFTEGSYYMFVGTTGASADLMTLKHDNHLYYFNGSYLVQVNLDNRIPSILSGSSAPTSSQGNNGDIYIQTS